MTEHFRERIFLWNWYNHRKSNSLWGTRCLHLKGIPVTGVGFKEDLCVQHKMGIYLQVSLHGLSAWNLWNTFPNHKTNKTSSESALRLCFRRLFTLSFCVSLSVPLESYQNGMLLLEPPKQIPFSDGKLVVQNVQEAPLLLRLLWCSDLSCSKPGCHQVSPAGPCENSLRWWTGCQVYLWLYL